MKLGAILGAPPWPPALLPYPRPLALGGGSQGSRSHCGCPPGQGQAAPGCLPSGLQSPCLGSSHQSEICFCGFQVGLSRRSPGTHCPLIPELFPCCGTVLPRQSQVVSGPTWSSPFSLPEGLGVPTSARQGLRSPGLGPVPPLPPNMLAALGFGPSFTTLWGLCLPGIRCSACGGASPGLSPPSHHGHSVRQPVSDLAWAAACRHVMGAACGACPSHPPRGYSPGSGHVGLGYYLGSLVGFSGGLNPSKKHRSGLVKRKTVWPGRVNLVDSRIFIPEFDAACPNSGEFGLSTVVLMGLILTLDTQRHSWLYPGWPAMEILTIDSESLSGFLWLPAVWLCLPKVQKRVVDVACCSKL